MEICAADVASATSESAIRQFFEGKSIFITGATGFLGHVLLSKLLRSCPGISHVYILLREKKGKTPTDRFDQLLEDEVFEPIKKDCPEALAKIRAISGDCSKPGLGMAAADRELLKSRVNVIFHVAATVRFDAPIRDAVHMNVRSTSDLLDLARELKSLSAFVHISTAFSNCVDRTVVEEKLYEPPVSAANLMTLVDHLDEDVLERITPGLLGSHPNTYVFTKAIAEDVCRSKGADLPLAIFRPAIVISTQKEPIPGWINNVYGPTGVVAAAAVGLMRVLYSEPNAKANIVPCDYVVNAAVASAWSIGTRDAEVNMAAANRKASPAANGTVPADSYACDTEAANANSKLANGNVVGGQSAPNGNAINGCATGQLSKKIPIYNFTSDLLEQPFTWKYFMDGNEKYEPEMPSALSIWYYSLTLCRNKRLYHVYCMLFHILPAFVADGVSKLLGKEPRLMDAYNKVHKLGDVLGYFSTREWNMTNDNVNFLWNRMSADDKKTFYFDMNLIDWHEYFYIHCCGIRKFILKEDPATIPAAIKRRRKLQLAHYALLSTLALFATFFVFRTVKAVAFAFV